MANKAAFITPKFLRPRPPHFLDLQTCSQLTLLITRPLSLLRHRNLLCQDSKTLMTPLGALRRAIKNKGRLDKVDWISSTLRARVKYFACHKAKADLNFAT